MSINNRKPVHLEYAGGKSPRQQIWEKIRSYQGKTFTRLYLIGDLPGTIAKDTTKTYVKSLVAAGYLEVREGPLYRLAKDNGVEAPRIRVDGSPVTQGRAQENLWRTLRTLAHPVTYLELAAMATTDEHPVAPSFARDYLGNLDKAGYLLQREGKKYQLKPAMNTGPRPPMVQRISQIYDPNLGKVVWSKGGDDE